MALSGSWLTIGRLSEICLSAPVSCYRSAVPLEWIGKQVLLAYSIYAVTASIED